MARSDGKTVVWYNKLKQKQNIEQQKEKETQWKQGKKGKGQFGVVFSLCHPYVHDWSLTFPPTHLCSFDKKKKREKMAICESEGIKQP